MNGKRYDETALLKYGFCADGVGFSLEKQLPCGLLFRMRVTPEKEETELWDPLSGEPYVLHRVEDAAGEFVGRVREEFARETERIRSACFPEVLFPEAAAAQLADYLLKTYGDEPEFLWEQYPDYAIWRRKDNRKWYALVGRVERKKLGLESGDTPILDFRMEPAELDRLVDGAKFFRGWHMNKKHWCTVLLDGSFSMGELVPLLEKSYRLAAGK